MLRRARNHGGAKMRNVATFTRSHTTMKLRSQQLAAGSRVAILLGLTALVSPAFAQDAAPAYENLEAFAASPGYTLFTANNLWMMICAALVFFMNLGFACVETGLTRSKNTVNILFKNAIIPCIGLLTYAIC